MGTFNTNVFFLIIIGNLWSNYPCSDAIDVSGLHGCECNIMDACNAQGNPQQNWDHYLPSGVDKFGYVVQGAQHLKYLCEDSTVAILFDCNSRIPLYSATVMTGKQLTGNKYPRPNKDFQPSTKIDGKCQQQKKIDYQNSLKRKPCFKKEGTETVVIDPEWTSSGKDEAQVKVEAAVEERPAKRARRSSVADTVVSEECILGNNPLVTINRGHLIASQYGRGDKERMLATFTYTNSVPQFGRFNSGPWLNCESRLIKWGEENCATGENTNVKLFIVAGAIPSTAYGPSKTRFFGKAGFSNYQNINDYPVNVPKFMWTAACCSFEDNGEEDDQGNLKTVYNTAFLGENIPWGPKCNALKRDIPTLTAFLSGMIPGNINLFPHTPQCNDKENYKPLP